MREYKVQFYEKEKAKKYRKDYLERCEIHEKL